MVLPKCSPATFNVYGALSPANKKLYKNFLETSPPPPKGIGCSLAPTNPTAYVGAWGTDAKGKLFPFSGNPPAAGGGTATPAYSDPATNTTGTCYADLVPIDAATWDSFPMNTLGGGGLPKAMTKKSFCNLATVDNSPDKVNLAVLAKQLMATVTQVYKKIQDMEYESRIYYQQHNTLNIRLQKELNAYYTYYNRLMALQKINSQPDLTLGGQSEDAQLRARSGYYQFFIWSILAAFTFSYTMFRLRR